VVEVAGWTPAGIVEARRPDLALLSERGFEHDPPWCPVDREPGMPLRPDGERLLASALETAGFANGLARSPDGSGWAVGLEGEILLVEEGSGRVRARRSLESRRVYALGWSAGGRDLFAGTDDSLLRVLAPETLEVLLTLDGHSSYIKALAVDRRSDTVFTASGDGSLRLWDRRSVAELHGRR
jgi:WD40 repeat protein